MITITTTQLLTTATNVRVHIAPEQVVSRQQTISG